MDSDLAEAVEGLKGVFKQRKLECTFGKTAPEEVEALRKKFRIPSRFRNFLLHANPIALETATPVERIRLLPSAELEAVQAQMQNWKPTWIVIGESALLGDPYFLDVSKPDPEGDCPVMTAMSGQDKWTPTLAASSFAQFLRIMTAAMEIAVGFGENIMDDEDEDTFREALVPKVKVIDTAALRAGHWT